MIIEILKGHEQPLSRTDGNGKERHSQTAFAHLGGPFPVQIRINLQGPNHFYAVGKYTLSLGSYKVGQYGDLQINGFETKLEPLQQQQQKVG